jgi:hypothetical protein
MRSTGVAAKGLDVWRKSSQAPSARLNLILNGPKLLVNAATNSEPIDITALFISGGVISHEMPYSDWLVAAFPEIMLASSPNADIDISSCSAKGPP